MDKFWISKVGVGTKIYENSTNWDPNGIPAENDDVYFFESNLNNVTITTDQSVSTFIVFSDSSFYITAYYNLYISKGMINQMGTVDLYQNITCPYMENNYLMYSGDNSYIKGKFVNNGLFYIWGHITFQNDYIGYQYSYLTNVLKNKYLEFERNVQINGGEVEFEGATILIQNLNISQGGTFKLDSSPLILFNKLEMTQSTMTVQDLDIFYSEGPALIKDDSELTFNNSNILFSNVNENPYQSLSVLNTALNKTSSLSFYNSSFSFENNTLALFLNSYVFLDNKSDMFINDGYLLMMNNSYFKLYDSQARIKNGSHFLMDYSYFVLYSYSLLAIQGGVTMKDNSRITLYSNSQLVTTSDIILVNSSLIVIAENSTLACSAGSLSLRHSSSLYIQNSISVVNGSIYVSEKAGFYSTESLFALSGSFYASGPDVKVVFNNSTLMLISDLVTAQGTEAYIINSEVSVVGSLRNLNGSILFDFSKVYILRNLYSQGLIVSNGSQIGIVGGNFHVDGKFIGEDLAIQINNGNLTMTLGSNFTCVNCDISLLAGEITIINGTLDTQEYFNLKGGIVRGNGTIKGNVLTTGLLGSDDLMINNITVNGSFNINSGKIIMVIDNFQDFSNIDILNQLNVTDTDIEIRINEDLLNSINNSQTFDLIKFNNGAITSNSNLKTNSLDSSSSNNGPLFNNVVFKSYTPNTTPKETEDCKLSVSSSKSKFSVLVSPEGCSSQNGEKTTFTKNKAWIAGVVIGCVAAVSITLVCYHFRNRLSLYFKIKKQTFGAKLKSFKS